MARRKSKKTTHKELGDDTAGISQLELLSISETQSVSNERAEQQDQQNCVAGFSQASEPVTEAPRTETASADLADASIGQRLRFAREQRGWTCEDVGARLKLQARLIRRIEEDDFSGIAHAVYLRGYLTSYARLLDMPQILAERVVEERGEQVPLVSTGRVSRSRYLMDRYSVSATYLILTALVVGPAVWLATHGGLEQNLARTVLLDAPTASSDIAIPDVVDSIKSDSTSSVTVSAPVSAEIGLDSYALTKQPVDAPPIIASMAPFAAASQTPRANISATPLPATDGRHSLSVKLTQASWVEIVDESDTKIEYALLPAGAERNYTSDTALTIRIGNAEGAEVVADGATIDLAPFQRANVARLRVFGGEKPASRVDS